MRLKKRVALVVGGAGSMGGSVARTFAKNGAAVCVADVDKNRAQEVSEQICEQGGQSMSIGLDVCESVDWNHAVEKVESTWGQLDIMANLSGANIRVDFDEQTLEMWQKIIDVNLTACFVGVKAVVPAMRRSGRGVVLFIGSLASLRQGAGSPAYGVSKIGLVALTRSVAASYARYGIRCVLISPGHVDTNFIREDSDHSPNTWQTSIDNPENYASREAATPLGRLCSSEDVAKSFLFAASDDASMITGSMLTVDGGAGI